MSVAKTREALTDKGEWIAPTRVLRLEKPRETGANLGEDRSTNNSHDRRGSNPSRRRAYHFDTAGNVSQWNGPVLTTPFAAQVIAQALNIHEDGAISARRAYRHSTQVVRAFMLDGDV
jgi:hypothetical protein